jgi:hypothetical protein
MVGRAGRASKDCDAIASRRASGSESEIGFMCGCESVTVLLDEDHTSSAQKTTKTHAPLGATGRSYSRTGASR